MQVKNSYNWNLRKENGYHQGTSVCSIHHYSQLGLFGCCPAMQASQKVEIIVLQ